MLIKPDILILGKTLRNIISDKILDINKTNEIINDKYYIIDIKWKRFNHK